MVKITEEEFTDDKGRVHKQRKIEAAHAKIEYSDGTVEEFTDCTATEWPFTPDKDTHEWKTSGIPVFGCFERLRKRATGVPFSPSDIVTCIKFFSENGETILNLIRVSAFVQFSQDSSDSFMGQEEPLEELSASSIDK